MAKAQRREKPAAKPPEKPNKIMRAYKLDPALLDRIGAASTGTGMSKTQIIEDGIRLMLGDADVPLLARREFVMQVAKRLQTSTPRPAG